jgi:hypothetical protein
MPIDIEHERLLTIAEATRILPGRPHIATVWRWVNHGVGGQRLETIKVGWKRFTSHEALARFIERTTAAADRQPIPTRTAKQRERDIARAERELELAGI